MDTGVDETMHFMRIILKIKRWDKLSESSDDDASNYNGIFSENINMQKQEAKRSPKIKTVIMYSAKNSFLNMQSENNTERNRISDV